MGKQSENSVVKNTQVIPFPQKPLWNETLDVLRKAQNIKILTNSKAIAEILQFNSEETRARYGRAIATRFSRIDKKVLSGFIDITKSEIGSKITEKIWRVLFCHVEPAIDQVYTELIWPREPGTKINRSEIRSYIEIAFKQQSKELYARILDCLRNASYILAQNKDDLFVVGLGDLEEALIAATHLLFGQTPRTLKLSYLECSNYWKFLGYRKFDHVKHDFHSAESKGLIMRYAIVDHLEQITTKYSWPEILRKIKLD